MWTDDRDVPEQVPLLARGKHRSPRKGACFMEMVSYLAGERWSDHPACTHPLLAAVARGVNDLTSDEGRPRLALLIPSVIGLTSDDPHVDARLALRCATSALPLAAAERQRVMAVAVLSCERVLNDLDGQPPGRVSEAGRQALAQAPHAARWARRYAGGHGVSVRGFRRHAAPSIVVTAIRSIAEACVRDTDQLLHDLLVDAISECATWTHRDVAVAVDPGEWARACELSGAAVRS